MTVSRLKALACVAEQFAPYTRIFELEREVKALKARLANIKYALELSEKDAACAFKVADEDKRHPYFIIGYLRESLKMICEHNRKEFERS